MGEVLRENHSGMETGCFSRLPQRRCWLRENHSGMETLWSIIKADMNLACCVRTIVVWKRSINQSKTDDGLSLRENHSGMETCTVFSKKFIASLLRENHSGMETSVSSSESLNISCCVRTIVVCLEPLWVVRGWWLVRSKEQEPI